MKKRVDIRFNTNFPQKSLYEWRVLVDGEEILVNNVRTEIPCWTTSTFLEGHGMKWHLTTLADEVNIDRSMTNNIVATIR